MSDSESDDNIEGALPLMERFTLFFDFLGTSTATSWPKDRLYPFLDLLIAIGAPGVS
jgi:hypothetical protein